VIDESGRLIDHDLGMSLRFGGAGPIAGINKGIDVDRQRVTEAARETRLLKSVIDAMSIDGNGCGPRNLTVCSGDCAGLESPRLSFLFKPPLNDDVGGTRGLARSLTGRGFGEGGR
jgi:hypothetical protein